MTVHGLGRGQVVADRADAAQPLHEHRDLPVGAALDEPLEAAELDDVQARLRRPCPCSSSRMVTLPWPSTRVTGSMTIFSGRCVGHVIGRSPSVVLDQFVGQVQRAYPSAAPPAPSQMSVRRGRAARQEVVDLHHLVAGVDPVQEQRQLRVVGDHAGRVVHRRPVEVGLLEALLAAGCRSAWPACRP